MGQDAGPATCLGLDHLADVVLQGDLHSGQLGSDCVAQLPRHRVQTLGDRYRGRNKKDRLARTHQADRIHLNRHGAADQEL